MEAKKTLISIIIPVFNEEQNIPLVHAGIMDAWKNLRDKYDCEIIFVNDGSADKSSDVLEKLAGNDVKIKCIEFSRNFGKEIAISAGIFHCQGEAAVIIDADMQHPPALRQKKLSIPCTNIPATKFRQALLQL